MPRIRQKAIQYLEIDFVKYLTSEASVQKKTHEYLATEVLGISVQAYSRKKHNFNFNYLDKLKLFKELKTPREIRIKLLVPED